MTEPPLDEPEMADLGGHCGHGYSCQECGPWDHADEAYELMKDDNLLRELEHNA